MGLTKEKIECLRKFVGYFCEQCKKHEAVCGTLEPHKIFPERGYILRNIKMCCHDCHEIFSSAQRKAAGNQG